MAIFIGLLNDANNPDDDDDDDDDDDVRLLLVVVLFVIFCCRGIFASPRMRSDDFFPSARRRSCVY